MFDDGVLGKVDGDKGAHFHAHFKETNILGVSKDTLDLVIHTIRRHT